MTRNMRILLFNVFDYINKKTYVTLGLYVSKNRRPDI